ncbi:thermonuclease family protein [Halopseudomonas bauzanensis]|uniref:Endonuclease YncB, thermonuclease family n=1 Tax=Halopseudomonas bauzanensis TaxID=653930 RepID=A0A1H9T8U6_9GAMM|nr:thermonuclease family protein [Halopseudomonas bauzanensis]SER93556.1 Endonuclease YncB, thermonuclease family [Halopseudomonas bauzanensis]SFL88709.1 Endonuclease YncB, thermonuclease family [Halopseudomonas bauzanensis]
MSDSKKALRWGAFFIAWLAAMPALAGTCGGSPDIGEPVVNRYVIDGDTLELVDGRRVRLIGINAPEIGRRGKASEPYAQRARTELEQLVEKAGLRLLVGEDAQDDYGRTLGHLFDIQGANIEAQLLRSGMGFAIGIPPNLALLDCHLRQESLAREAELGVWRQAPIIQAAEVRQGGFQLVRGRVLSIERAGRYFWLELDGSLVLRIAADQQGFGQLDSWRGRSLEVRGWVVDRGTRRRDHKRFMLPLREPKMANFD